MPASDEVRKLSVIAANQVALQDEDGLARFNKLAHLKNANVRLLRDVIAACRATPVIGDAGDDVAVSYAGDDVAVS